MNENEFWLKFWVRFFAGLSAFALIIAVGTNYASTHQRNTRAQTANHERDAIVQMVKSGASPIEASCALDHVNAGNGVRAILCHAALSD